MNNINQTIDSHLGLREFFYVLFRHKKKIFFFFLVVMGIVSVMAFTAKKTYLSDAKLFIKLGRETVSQNSESSPSQRILVSQTLENQINSELEILLSQETASEVVKKIGVGAFQKDPDQHRTSVHPFAEKIQEFVKLATGFPKKLFAKFQAPAAQNALPAENNEIEIAALVLRKDLKAQVISDSNIIKLSYETYSPKLARDVLTQLITVYMDKHMQLHSTPESYGFFKKESSKFQGQLEATERKIQALKNEIGSGYTSASINELNNVIYELKLKEQELLATFTETSIPVLDIRKQIQKAQTQLDKQLTANNAAEVRLVQLEREKDRLEKNYRKYADALEQTRIDQALEAEKISNIRIAQAPNLPLEPVRPRSGLILALGFFAAIFGGLGLAFFSNYMDNSLQKPEQVEEILELPVLGSIQEMSH